MVSEVRAVGEDDGTSGEGHLVLGKRTSRLVLDIRIYRDGGLAYCKETSRLMQRNVGTQVKRPLKFNLTGFTCPSIPRRRVSMTMWV